MKCRYCENIIEVSYDEVCDDCCECQKCDACISKNELAYENFLSDYYGSSEPFTLNEKLEQAKKEGN